MRKKFWSKLLVASGMVFAMSGATMATEGYYENDVTPPWGRLSIVDALEVGNMSYVDSQNIKVKIYASDDMCLDNEIKYHISTSEILDTAKITAWEDYTTDMIVDVNLPSASATNKIYIVFKDKNGNTSLVYNSSLSQNVVYDLKAADATMATGMATQRVYGAPFVVTSQTPKREGYYFKGWAINSTDTEASFRQGDIIPADMAIGTDTTATLYAIWTTELSDMPLLADVVETGDYVNYPVYYDNVKSAAATSPYNGWRVISKDKDIDGTVIDGTVNLVSAGVPLTYYHDEKSTYLTITNLATNFSDTAFTASNVNGFQKNGFNPYHSLMKIFTNNYTAIYNNDTSVTYPAYSTETVTVTKTSGTLKIRAMTVNDITEIAGEYSSLVLKNEKYRNLFTVNASYWLADGFDSSQIRYVSNVGSAAWDDEKEYGVRPVVSLKPGIVVTGTDAIGAWDIEIIE